MIKPDTLPANLPADVKALLSSLKPEPAALLETRKRLLTELGTQSATAQGALRDLLHATRAALQALQAQVALQAQASQRFARALERYVKESGAAAPPPLILECMRYLRERVEAMGLGALMAQAQARAQARNQA